MMMVAMVMMMVGRQLKALVHVEEEEEEEEDSIKYWMIIRLVYTSGAVFSSAGSLGAGP